MTLAGRALRTRWLVRAPILLYRNGFGFLFGQRMLLMEHRGRRSGLARHVVLEVVEHPHPDTYVVVSGFGEASRWYRNLVADPHVRIGHISAVLCQLSGRDLRSILLRDDQEQVRVVLRRPSFADVLDVAITQPRRYGSSDPQVMARLFRLLEELAYHVHDHDPVRAQLARLRNTLAASDFDDVERGQLKRAGVRVDDVIAGRVTAESLP